jgi:Flp pilus assembly protein TadG
MVRRIRHPGGKQRQAAAAVELAILIPFLSFLLVITVDWARVFYYSLTLENCARQGALYGSGAAAGSSIQSAAQNDWVDPGGSASGFTVTSASGSDGNGDPTIAVTASCTVNLVTNYPGIGSSVNLSHTVTMRVAQ